MIQSDKSNYKYPSIVKYSKVCQYLKETLTQDELVKMSLKSDFFINTT